MFIKIKKRSITMIKKIIAIILLLATLTLSFAGCSKNDPLKDYTEDTSTEKKDYYYVAMAIKNHGVIIVKLDAVNAPITTANFVKLVREGFYNGLTFHRVIENFMIQGGDPDGIGTGGPGYSIKGEFAANGIKNDLKHTRGVISMARAMDPDSAGSQFFIMHKDAPHLDGNYAAFGKLIEGFDELDRIAKIDTDFCDKPRKAQRIKTITIED
jgi:peptidyl-prolyl cis-trans isomerase B (cyclophilin B)